MTRTKLLLGALLAVPVIAVGAVALPGVEPLRPWVERAASAALERPVAIEGGLRLAWSGGPTLVAAAVRLPARPGEPADPARLGRLELRPALLPLLAGRLELDRVLLADAEITLPAGEPASGPGTGAPRHEAAAAPTLPVLRAIRLERVRVAVPGSTGDPPRLLTLAELDAALPDPTGPLEVALRGRLDDRPLAARLVLDSPAALLERRAARLEPLAVSLAGSDLEGALAFDPGGPRPRLEGRLASRRLDVPSIAALVRGPGAPPSADASTGPGARGRTGRDRVIPDLPIDLSGLRGLEGRLELRVEEMPVGGTVLRRLALPLELGGGRLRVGPIEAELAGGRILGRLEADAAQPQASLGLVLEARGLDTGRLQRELGTQATLEAGLDLDLELAGRGRSLGAVLAAADGRLTAALGGGRIRAAPLDRLAGGVREAARALLVDRSEGWVELRCGAFDLPLRSGVAELRVAVLETAAARLSGEGRIDLGAERLDLALLPRSRGATLSVAVPIRVRGSLAAPEIAIDQREAARRGALGLLGALVFPPAALAAFADLGAGGNPCLSSEPPPAEGPAPAATPSLPGTDALRRGLEGLLGGGRQR